MTTLSPLVGVDASFDQDTLTIETGKLRRQYRWTGHGFRTSAISYNGNPFPLASQHDTHLADWALPSVAGEPPAAELINVSIDDSNDEGFTNEHTQVVCDMHYPSANLDVRLELWLLPNTNGMRSALWVRGTQGYTHQFQSDRQETTEETLIHAQLSRGYTRSHSLPIDVTQAQRHMIGYYAHTQVRNDVALPMLQESSESHPLTFPRVSEWCNAVAADTNNSGLICLKESHKTMSTEGHDTGVFIFDPQHGILNSGWGILPREIDDQYRPAWAHWIIGYDGGQDARQRATKTFDQARYPVSPRDCYTQANTWGSSIGYLQHRDAAGEASVLGEIEACADIGIDVLQIDDGWQGNNYDNWTPIAPRYTDGWQRVREAAHENGIELGLWLAAEPPSLEDLNRNADEGDFISFKLDFASLTSREKIDGLMNKVRSFVKGRDHKVRVNWDLTERCVRYGIYYGREFGCLYLANRKPVWPRSTTYRPAAMLSDLWDLSHYTNLLKIQGSTQNIDMVDPQHSDAQAYTHDYCLAITLMSTPLFFCEMKHYSEAARAQLRPLLAAYKQVREEIFTGMIQPLGLKPDGTQWTGFECELPNGTSGYLTLFREAYNQEASHNFSIKRLANKTLTLTNLMTKESQTVTLDDKGGFSITMDASASYRFLSYEVVG